MSDGMTDEGSEGDEGPDFPSTMIDRTTPEERRRGIRILFVSLMGFGMGTSIMFSILPPIAREIGLSEMQVGAIFATPSILMLLLSPYWGRKSDVWGRKPILLMGLFAHALATLLFAILIHIGLEQWWPVWVVWLLMAGSRGIFGALGSGIQPAGQAYVADRTTMKERTRSLALMGAAGGIGTVIGPGVGAVLVPFGILVPYLLVVLLAASCGVFIWLLLPERTTPAAHGFRSDSKLSYLDPRIRFLVAVAVSVSVVMAGGFQTVGFYIMDSQGLVGEEAAQMSAVSFMVNAAGALFIQLVVIRMFNLSPRTLIRTGIVFLLVTFCLLIVAYDIWVIMVAMLFFGLGMGMVMPGLFSAASLSVAYDEQGAVAGIMAAANVTGFVVNPVTMLLLYQWWYIAPYIANVGILTVLLAVAVFHPKMRRLPHAGPLAVE